MRQYLSLKGRSSRREWWTIEILVIAGLRLNELAFDLLRGDALSMWEGPTRLWIVGWLVLGWMNIASNIRRLHDRGKSGWWSLLYLFPGLGQLWCIIECGFLKGQPNVNRYGPPPAIMERYNAEARAAVKVLATQPPAEAPEISATARGFGRRPATLSAAKPRPAVARASSVTRIEPRRRNLGAALVVGTAIVLGIVTIALTVGIPAPATVVTGGANADLPVFKPIDKSLTPR